MFILASALKTKWTPKIILAPVGKNYPICFQCQSQVIKTCNSNSRLFSETSSAVLSLGFVLFVLRAVQTIEPMDEILWCDHSNETSSTVLSHGAICFVCGSNFWVCGCNPMMCDHSNETSSAILSHNTICFARSFNFWDGSQWTTETIQTKPLFLFCLVTLAKQILNIFHSCLYKTIM